jgi:hypothetical protein
MDKNLYTLRYSDCRDSHIYNQTIHYLEEIFQSPSDQLMKIIGIAKNFRKGLEKINQFVQQTTRAICPYCKDVCCISKHGYYSCEDLVYLYALGLRPPHYEFGRKDSDPCQYLSEHGCIMERSIRPSGCNWYFCDSLLDHMEVMPDYTIFDDSLRDAAELWLEMMEEFDRTSSAGSVSPT